MILMLRVVEYGIPLQMNKLLACIILALNSCGLGLNQDDKPEYIQHAAPDKLGLNFKFDEGDEFQGYNVGLSWDID